MTEERRSSEGLGKSLNPPMNVPHNMRRADLRQGGQNRYRGQRSDAIRETFRHQFPYNEVQDKISRRENKIEYILGASIFKTFQLLDESGNHNMTVPEIQERRSERLVILGPEQQSVFQELLEPSIDLVWHYMGLHGDLEPPPPELSGMPLRVQFTSQLALEQLAAVTNGMRSYVGAVAEIDAVIPGILDNVDGDKVASEMRQGYVVPPTIGRDPEDVAAMRAERARILAEQQQAEQQRLEAQTTKDLGQTPLGDGTALDAVAGQ